MTENEDKFCNNNLKKKISFKHFHFLKISCLHFNFKYLLEALLLEYIGLIQYGIYF